GTCSLGQSAVDARTHGGAPGQSGLRVVPSADGSDRPVDREFRRDRTMARQIRVGRADRCLGRFARRLDVRWCRRSSPGVVEPARVVRVHVRREVDDLRARPRRRLPRCARDPGGRSTGEPERLPLFLHRARHRQEPRIPNEEDSMIVRKLALPRRTFLRGMGATLALPLLEPMVPARTATAKTAANPVRRLGFVYLPMGATPGKWAPPVEGALTELSPILNPLAPYVDHLTVISNLEHKNAYAAGNHATAN